MKKIALLIIATFITANVFSAYLRNFPIELKLPDGSIIITSNVSNNVDGLGKKLMPNQLPIVVDNSKWFPPAELQLGPVCSYFSRIYYLKSYLWNRHFNRDSKLPENQFSPYFAWNQNIATISHFNQGDGALRFMRNQGCSSVRDFNLFPNSEEVMPSLGARERALSYKSKQITGFNINGWSTDSLITEKISALKDSLAKGIPCVTNIPNLMDLWIKQGPDLIFNYSEEVNWSNIRGSHDIVIVGYNDTIKTKYGRGAFKLLNSNGIEWGNNGFGYMAYNWFHQKNWPLAVDFLIENFDYQPDMLLNLNIKNTISDVDRAKYFFVDTIYNYPVMDTTVHDFKDKQVDFPSGFGSLYPNTFRIKSINGRKILVEGAINGNDPESFFFKNNRLFIPQHNHSGNYEILSDLTDYLNGENFNSFELLINDPISTTLTGDNDQQLFSFVREAKAEVSSVFIKSLKSSYIIKGKVSDLPDTTIICSDFYSALDLLGRNFNPMVLDGYIHIKQCITKLKRKIITFNIADKQTFIVPFANAGSDQIVNEGATVSLDGSNSFAPNGSSITYKWTSPIGISLSSTTLKNPTFTTLSVSQDTSYIFSLVVNDGISDSPADEVVITVKQLNEIPVANAGNDIMLPEGMPLFLDGTASYDPNGKSLTYKWIVPEGITLSSLTIAKPTFTAPEVSTNTSYIVSLVVNNGTYNSVVDQIKITVKNYNKIPAANAGNDQILTLGATVTLDGSQSSDPDGDPLTYKWTAPAGVTLSSTSIAKPTFIAPEVSSNTNYTFTLVVNDGTVDSPVDQVVITVKNVNKAPIANAGADKSVNEGSTVTLDGSASSDPDGNALTYKWTAPAGITLSSTTAAKPTFTAPEVMTNTNFIFFLEVNDGTVDSPVDQVVIAMKNVNKVPIANAGVDQSVNEGATVSLDGLVSSDPDGDPLTYKWTAPVGITLSSTSIAKPTFSAPEVMTNTNYIFSLVVNDGTVDSPADQVVITVKKVNKAPVANAGSDQTVKEGSTVSLNGSWSYEPDGDYITFKWNAPTGITLSSTTIDQPTFTAPEVKKDSTLSFSLVVNDGFVNSLPASVKVTVLNIIKVGISDLEFPILKVFPNPTTGIINIELSNGTDKDIEISVTNLLGVEVFRKEMTDATKFSIDLSNQINGIYMLKVIIDNQQSISKIVLRKE